MSFNVTVPSGWLKIPPPKLSPRVAVLPLMVPLIRVIVSSPPLPESVESTLGVAEKMTESTKGVSSAHGVPAESAT